jgi:hypothetical protein
MNDSKWSLNQIAFLNTSAVDEVVAEEIEKLKLMAGQLWVLNNKLIYRTRNSVWEAFENLDPQNVADESEKRRRLVLLNPTQKLYRYVRMLSVKLSCEYLGLFVGDKLRIANLSQNGIICSEFIHFLFDQLSILRDAERFVLRAKLDEVLRCEHIGEVELGWAVADTATVTEMHERRELRGEVIEALVGHGGPIVIGLGLLNEPGLLRNDIHRKWEFADLRHEVL